MRYLVLLLLAGCAGNSAMQWKPPTKPECSILVCDMRWPEKPCTCGDMGRFVL